MHRFTTIIAASIIGAAAIGMADSASAQVGVEKKGMKGFVGDIEKLTEENSNYRRVLYAHSDDRDHPFRRIATTCSDRSRPV